MAHKTTFVGKNTKFSNVHGNYSEPFTAIVQLFNSPKLSGFESYNETSESVKSVIRESLDKNLRLRAIGSRWSLSKAPYVNGMLLFSRDENEDQSMKFNYFLKDEDLNKNERTSAPKEKDEFLFSQCGNTIRDLNELCLQHKRSLLTSGASNGQTIAGVIGTGVHGSSIDVGSLQDTVYGLHIIKGPNLSDSIYLEPTDLPVANEEFAKKINARLVRDDEQFYAALMGLGAFGYVHGVLVKTEAEFFLHNFIKAIDISKVYDFLKTIDVKNNGLNIEGMVPEMLFHMKFYINQYRLKDNVRAEIIYKFPQEKVRRSPEFLSYNKDFLLTVARPLSSIFRFLIPGQIDKQLPEDGIQEYGSMGDIFKETTNLRGGQFSCAVAIDNDHSSRFLKMVLDLADNHKKIPSTFSLRFVKKSKATLAFTKFDMNCLFGIDGIETNLTKDFLSKLNVSLKNSDIPHAWHWGKFNYLDKEHVKSIYKNDRERWITARNKFFNDPRLAQAFSSNYLHERGLSQIIKH